MGPIDYLLLPQLVQHTVIILNATMAHLCGDKFVASVGGDVDDVHVTAFLDHWWKLAQLAGLKQLPEHSSVHLWSLLGTAGCSRDPHVHGVQVFSAGCDALDFIVLLQRGRRDWPCPRELRIFREDVALAEDGDAPHVEEIPGGHGFGPCVAVWHWVKTLPLGEPASNVKLLLAFCLQGSVSGMTVSSLKSSDIDIDQKNY